MNHKIQTEIKNLVREGIGEQEATAITYRKFGKDEAASEIVKSMHDEAKYLAEETLKHLTPQQPQSIFMKVVATAADAKKTKEVNKK